MITYNVDGVKMPKIKKRDTSAWIRKVAASHVFFFPIPTISPTDPLPPYSSGEKP